MYLETPASSSLQDPPLLVVPWVTEAPPEELEEDAGVCLAMNMARNSPGFPISRFPTEYAVLQVFTH